MPFASETNYFNILVAFTKILLKLFLVSRHFSQNNHNASHFSIQIIEKCKKEDTAYRKTRENFWELTLKPQINVIKSHLHDAFK